MSEWRLRLRAILDDQFTTILVGVLIVGLLGGWLSYSAYIASGPTTEERTETLWETTGEFSHGTTVESNSSVFPVGARLTDRPLYFTRISPRLSGQFRSTYAGPPSDNLTRYVSVELIIRAVDQQAEGDNTVYWQTSQRLNETTIDSVDPEEPITVSFGYNIPSIDNRTDRIHEQLGATAGSTEVSIRATVSSRGRVGETGINETNNYTVPVVIEENTYRLEGSGPTTHTYETTRTETVDPTAGPVQRLGGPAVVGVALSALGGLVIGRRRGVVTLSESERDRLAYQENREEFDSWISPVDLPEEAFELPRAEAESLTALVDIAIDTNNSVIEDPDEACFYLRHDGYLYSYRPPTAQADAEAETEVLEDQSATEPKSDVDAGDSETADQ